MYFWGVMPVSQAFSLDTAPPFQVFENGLWLYGELRSCTWNCFLASHILFPFISDWALGLWLHFVFPEELSLSDSIKDK